MVDRIASSRGKIAQRRAGAVAEDLLHRRAEFAEGAVVFDDFEERVVAEAVAAGGLEADAAAADVFGGGADRAGWVGDRDVADVVCRSLFERRVGRVQRAEWQLLSSSVALGPAKRAE